MELTDRKLQILKAVIEEYAESGQPVGSRVLARRRGLALSAATLRNEMADLEEMGFLEKPHTSAGRKPTIDAYRMYVDRMLDMRPLSEYEKKALGSDFSEPMEEVQQVCGTAAGVISRLTGCVAVVASPSLDMTRLQRVQVIRVDRARAMAIFVTAAATVRQALIPIGSSLTDAELAELSGNVTRALCGVALSDAGACTAALTSNADVRYKHVISELVSAISRDRDSMEIYLKGQQNIWLHPEYQDWRRAQQILSLLEQREWLEKVLRKTPDEEFSIRLGEEAAGSDLADLGVVTGAYDAGGGSSAAFGVIGPVRMNYQQVLPILRGVGRRMSCALKRLADSGVGLGR